METDTVMSIIAIIVGIIIMAFPFLGVAATSVIFGLGFIIWGVITLLYSYMLERVTGPFAASGIIIGILMIIFGAALIFSPELFASVLSILIYIVGFFILIIGLISLFASPDKMGKTSGIVGVIIGIIYIILGYIVSNPSDFGFLIGLGILIMGILGILNR